MSKTVKGNSVKKKVVIKKEKAKKVSKKK